MEACAQHERSMLVGELAAATGLTVRTLHHYDRLGLLKPSARTERGYRLYSPGDVESLYRIRALQTLGLPLRDIQHLLDDDTRYRDLSSVIEHQLARVRTDIVALAARENQLSMLRDALDQHTKPEPLQLLSMIGRMTMLEHALRHDYSKQASRYDHTRGVSSPVLNGIVTALQGAPGRSLLDIGGGTGDYAAALRDQGWAPTILGASSQMRREAEPKGLPAVAGEATRLPFGDNSFDAVTMISMLHQVGNWRQAIAEASRVLRPQGHLAIMMLTAEHIREVAWVYDLFPSMRAFALDHRPSHADLVNALPDAQITPFWFDDLSDASIGALCGFPEAILDRRLRTQTSFFDRLERDHPHELETGLATLQARLANDQRPDRERAEARQRLGDGSIIAWHKHGPPGPPT